MNDFWNAQRWYCFGCRVDFPKTSSQMCAICGQMMSHELYRIESVAVQQPKYEPIKRRPPSRPKPPSQDFVRRFNFWKERIGDDEIARRQANWERRKAIRTAIVMGMPVKEVSQKMEISENRCRNISYRSEGVSPVQEWLSKTDHLPVMLKKMRKVKPTPLWMHDVDLSLIGAAA